MGPRGRARQEIIELLGRAAEHAQYAEDYHAAAADPGALEGRAAQQAACDAAAMQLIELAGCAEDFIRDRGEPGTTLARLDRALEPVFEMRNAHTHPERVPLPRGVTPARLGDMIKELTRSLENLDSDTLSIETRDQRQALNTMFVGLSQIGKDGLPDAAALRPRDLHYAGYYREIQFARLMKATGLFVQRNSDDLREAAVSSSISDADDMAHKFHLMRGVTDKNVLPPSVVGCGSQIAGRPLSEVMRQVRHDLQMPAERLAEREAAVAETARLQYREAVRGLAQQYARMAGDAEAATLVHDYVHWQQPPLDREIIDAMRQALDVAAAPAGDYLAQPEAVKRRCLEMCFAFDRLGDSRLLDILDAAERRGVVGETRTAEATGVESIEAAVARNAPQPAQQTGVEEKDLYLAMLLRGDDTELSQDARKPESEGVREGPPKRGRSL
jgi:hypothetical protein